MTRRPSLGQTGALLAALSVAAGAFGAHGASTPQAADWLRTGGLYGLIHGAAVFAMEPRHKPESALLLMGSAVFAATLWAMAFGAPRWLGAVTPVGGALMIAGWLLLAIRSRSR